MVGYLSNQAATDAIFDRDGWLHTGDIGHIDADGHLYVVDRLKELIKYKGFQVPPAELEALLLTHPAVADAAVVGLPDEEAGEIPVAYVVLRPGAEATPEEIQEFVAGQVAHYKQVRKVRHHRRDPEVGVGQDPATAAARPGLTPRPSQRGGGPPGVTRRRRPVRRA